MKRINCIMMMLIVGGCCQSAGINNDEDTDTDTSSDTNTDTDTDTDEVAAAIIAIAAGDSFSVYLTEDGTVSAVGDNTYGQLGNGSTETITTPVQVLGPNGVGYLTDIIAIATGDFHSIALSDDGAVFAWGINNDGQIGNNSDGDNILTPVQTLGMDGVGYLTGIVAISAGAFHSIALSEDGGVLAWGLNIFGQIGDNTIWTDRFTPVQVVGVGGTGYLNGIISVSAGAYHSIALSEDGTVFAWGTDNDGQIGNNSAGDNVLTPTQVIGVDGVDHLNDIVEIGGGAGHSLAVTSDGKAYAWGKNDSGQIGNGTTISPVLTPTIVTIP